MLFVQYPKCSTCKKAKKWLDEHDVNYTDRNIAEDNPKYEELKEWYKKSGLPLKKFFNTCGLVYKEMGLKDKVSGMSEEEMLNIKKIIISCGSPEKIELLPYHAMGEHKYAAIGKQAQTFSVPSKEKISQLKRVFV